MKDLMINSIKKIFMIMTLLIINIDSIQGSSCTNLSDEELQEINLFHDFDMEFFDFSQDSEMTYIDSEIQSNVSSLSHEDQEYQTIRSSVNGSLITLTNQYRDAKNNTISNFSNGTQVVTDQQGISTALTPNGTKLIQFPGSEEVQIISRLNSQKIKYEYYNKSTKTSRVVIFQENHNTIPTELVKRKHTH